MDMSLPTKLIGGFACVMIFAVASALIGLFLGDPAGSLEGHFTFRTALVFAPLCLSGGIAAIVVRLCLRQLASIADALSLLKNQTQTSDLIVNAQAKLDANLGLLRDLLYANGDPRKVGDKLYFGDVAMNENNDFVDKVQAAHGGAATVFLGDMRIATNIKDQQGQRQVGTRLAKGPAFDAALTEGKSYRGEAQIFGEAYLAIYEPIVAGRDIIGAIFVSVKKSEALKTNAGAANPKQPPLDMAHRMADDIGILRDINVGRDRAMRDANEQRFGLADARRKQKAMERATAIASQNVVGALSAALERLAASDLTHRIDAEFPPEYQKVKDDFGGALSALRDTMIAISDETQSMRGHSTEIVKAVDELSRRTEQQAASLEETAASLDLITATVRRTADGVDDARKVVAGTKTAAEHSSGVVRQAVTAMSEIEESARKIGQIIGVIDEIASQTNLLALNAGVEAARAGDAGRGFSVVATEVRALSQRSAEAAKEIKALVAASNQQVKQGVALVNETGTSLALIVSQVADVNEIIVTIAASAQEQALSLQEVNTAINQMDQVTQQNAAMVEESTAASHHLAEEAAKLESLVGQFKTGVADTVVATPHRVASSHPGAKPRQGKQVARPMMKTVGGSGRSAAVAVEKDWEEF